MKQINALGIISLVLGIIGILLSCIIIGVIPSILGLILGCIAVSEKNNIKKGISIAGIVCSSFGILFFLFFVVLYILIGKYDTTNSNKVGEINIIESEESTQEPAVTHSEEPTIVPAETSTPTVEPTQTPEPTLEPIATPTPTFEIENVLSEEDYKESCVELFYDDIFFSQDDLEGKDVKLNLFVSELYELREKDMYYDYIQEMFGEYNLQRNFLKCCVLREGTESYMGEQINVLFSNDYGLNATDYSGGEKITVYGKIIGYSTNSWRGYNKCEFMPLYIE
jgi:hypothetical protein